MTLNAQLHIFDNIHRFPDQGNTISLRYGKFMAEAEQLNLYSYFGVTMEQMPAWVWRRYPDCRLVNAFGEWKEMEPPRREL